MIPKPYKDNFETLLRAARQGRLALVECLDRKTGETAYMVTAIGDVPGSTEKVLAPFARMVDEDPYKRYAPPAVGGGFEGESDNEGESWKEGA